MEYKGIDVSKWQGTIDWSKVTADFVMIRLGFSNYNGGLNIDSKAIENMKGAKAYSIPFGVYVYSYDKSIEAAKKTALEVSLFLSGYTLDFPVAFDFEDQQFYDVHCKNENAAICRVFMDEIKNAGYYPMLYTFSAFAMSYLDMTKLQDYDLWIADYTGKVTYPGHYTMWQYSGSGAAAGISGQVDLDICYINYPEIIKSSGRNGHLKESEITTDDYKKLLFTLGKLKEIETLVSEIRKEIEAL